MKINIFIFAFNRPDLLEYQIRSLRKYLKTEYELIVIHDSRKGQYVDKFYKITNDNDIAFYHHPSIDGKSSSSYHAEAIQWAYDTIIKVKYKNQNIILLDHDMFLIDDLDLTDYFNSYDMIGCLQTRNEINYIWPGIFAFKEGALHNLEFDFNPQVVKGNALDTGGGTYKLLQNNSLKYKDSGVSYPDEYNGIYLKNPSLTNGYDYELHLDNKFLHFRNASNWHNNYMISDQNKTNLLNYILNDILVCTT